MMIKNQFLLFLSLLIGSIGFAQVTVSEVSDFSTPQNSEKGVYYALPLTVLNVKMTVKKTAYYKGPYAYYAKEMLGLEDVVAEDYNEYSIVATTLSSEVMPDPNRIYYAQPVLDQKDTKTKIHVSRDGFLLAINSQGEEPARVSEIEEGRLIEQQQLFSYGTTASVKAVVDTIIRVVTVDTSVFKRLYFNTAFERTSDKEKARDIANLISSIREDQRNLLNGYQEISYEADALAFMYNKLNEIIEEYISLFRGVKVVTYETHTFQVIPNKNDPQFAKTVCWFNPKTGIHQSASNGGSKVLMKYHATGATSNVMAFETGGGLAEQDNKGVVYAVPEMTKISIEYVGQPYLSEYVLVSQLGVISRLSQTIKAAQFNPTTGAVLKVEF